MTRRTATLAGVLTATVGMVAAMAIPAQAQSVQELPGSAATDVSPDMLSAMQRDLGLTAEQARTRIAADDRASRLAQRLRGQLAERFGGAWVGADGATVTVAVTDAAEADTVRAAGAQAKVVARSERQLNAAQSKLDKAGAGAPAGVAGWYVDLATNSVVVLAPTSATGAAARFAKASGADPAAVRVAVSAEVPRTLADIRGGDAYYMGGRCSIGFSVNGGFVTAGHCGSAGTATQGAGNVAQGTVRASSFPGNDFGWVAVNSNWIPRGVVNRYNGSTVGVSGSSPSAVGASICRSGSTTGWRCGTVQATNATVRYQEGTVSGLTRTSACADRGDSGGSWLSGNQAQGVTSGGSGTCNSGGATTYFQPVNEILSAYGLSLVTS